MLELLQKMLICWFIAVRNMYLVQYNQQGLNTKSYYNLKMEFKLIITLTKRNINYESYLIDVFQFAKLNHNTFNFYNCIIIQISCTLI